MMFELITNEKQIVTKGSIEFDNSIYLEQLKKMTAMYANSIIKTEDIQAAKREVANLRKFTKQIEDFRKDKKNEYLVPLQEFEAKVKELTNEIEKSVKHLTEQLDVFEEKRKAAKKEKIEEMITDMDLDFEVEWGKDWLNAAKQLGKIQEEITKQLYDKIEKDRTDKLTADLLQQKKVMLEDYIGMFQSIYRLDTPIKYTEVEYLLEFDVADLKETLKEIFELRQTNELKFREAKLKVEQAEEKTTTQITIIATKEQEEKLRKFLFENKIEFYI